MLKKKIVHAFGDTYYLLGKDEDGVKWYLRKSTWDCSWYWGFGYLDSFTNNACPEKSKDISGHTHLSLLMAEFHGNGVDALKNHFKECVLADDELFRFVDYVKTGYALKEAAELFGLGHSNYTEKAKIDDLVKPDWVNEINEKMIPEINAEIEKMLSPDEENV